MKPSLSKTERERIDQAAALAKAGAKIHWRNIGRRLSYVVDGKEHLVLTSGTDRVHGELAAQVAAHFNAATVKTGEAA